MVKEEGKTKVITKGAFNAVIEICDSVETNTGQVIPVFEMLTAIRDEYTKICNAGYRVLGVACKKPTGKMEFTGNDEKNMTFQGFITLFDPPKNEVIQTINELHSMGVQLKIITGASCKALLTFIPPPPASVIISLQRIFFSATILFTAVLLSIAGFIVMVTIMQESFHCLNLMAIKLVEECLPGNEAC